MIRQTRAATEQIEALFDHYVSHDRPEAARHLLGAVNEALGRIEADPGSGRPYPRPYPGVARWGFRWLKVHRYWFGYAIRAGYPVLTNVIYETANLPRRVQADDADT